MAKLTSLQVNELANYFLQMAQTVGDYRIQYFDTLTSPQNKRIKELQAAILKRADELFTLSAILVLDDAQVSLSSISEVTNQMKSTLKTLLDVQRAINIAASVVTLAGAILKKNPQAIGASIRGLIDLLKPPPAKP